MREDDQLHTCLSSLFPEFLTSPFILQRGSTLDLFFSVPDVVAERRNMHEREKEEKKKEKPVAEEIVDGVFSDGPLFEDGEVEDDDEVSHPNRDCPTLLLSRCILHPRPRSLCI